MEFKTGNVNEEKHVPFIQKIDGGYNVKVGKPADHPMTEEHFISEIKLVVDGKEFTKTLKPGDAPEAKFDVDHGSEVAAFETCNLHGT
jgi:superoxide reductase